MEMDLGDGLKLRNYRMDDAQSLAKYANNKKVWKNLRDIFPHPYTLEDAEGWLKIATSEPLSKTNWAIEYQGEAIGGIGLKTFEDVHRLTAEIGYWIGEPFWGKGIVTKAVGAVCKHGFEEMGLVRIFTAIFEWNPPSGRVLEKNGFVKEGVERRSIIKDGKIIDAIVYAKVKE
jgi:RimJ/RimL family protein N-acetyltransferase